MNNAITIRHYSSVVDLIRENTTKEEETALSQMFDTKADYIDFLHIDDFEDYGYFLLDYQRIIVTMDDTVIYRFDSMEDFIEVSAREMKEWRERA